MNLSFSFLSGSILELLSEILDMLDELHTVGIEFTVMRHNSLPIGLEINIQCLLAEQRALHAYKKDEIYKKNTNHGRIPLE